MASPLEILTKYWGFPLFRPLQEEIIQAVLSGHDTLALLPTGGGKSVCFQVPGLLLPGITIVISPLIALMKDQVEHLKKQKIPAVFIHSGMHQREIDILLDNCIYGIVKFLFLSPERLKTELFVERVKKMKVNLIAVDEAHCISQWGYDFRPPYLEIAVLRETLKDVPVIALTASATPDVQEDIMQKLCFKNGKSFKKSFVRTNLSYSVFKVEDKEKKLLEILKAVQGTAIVYVRNRKKTKELATLLAAKGISAAYYHAGLTATERAEKQDIWMKNRIRVIVATNAFGMGIDKPDVRVVVNYDFPENLESYYQEAGRGGRDEKKAFAVLLYNELSIQLFDQKVKEAFPEIAFIKKVYQALANYFKVAVGSSAFASFDFVLEEFVKIYKFPPKETYNALKLLEEQGFIELNESFFNPSKCYIAANKETLYAYQVANPSVDALIKILLRLYGGEAFSSFVSISEKIISNTLRWSVQEVQQKLEMLHNTQMLIYERQKTAPQIVFLTPRFDAATLPLDTKRINERKQVKQKQAQTIKAYAQNLTVCRTKILVNYFGEENFESCGVCDICLSRKQNQKEEEQVKATKKEIMDLLAGGVELFIEALLAQIKNSKRVQALQLIREMLDVGLIEFKENGKIGIK